MKGSFSGAGVVDTSGKNLSLSKMVLTSAAETNAPIAEKKDACRVATLQSTTRKWNTWTMTPIVTVQTAIPKLETHARQGRRTNANRNSA